MGAKQPLEGKRFGKLIVLAEHPDRGKRGEIFWVCKCDCGNTKIINGNSLRRGTSTTCGCSTRKHGMRNTRLWRIFDGMLKRCYSPNHPWYKRYGGRGIKICDEWLKDRSTFFSWAMANGYQDDLTIDRIDTDGIYSPDNCRWVDQKTQINNRSNTPIVEINGERKTISEWASIAGVSYQTMYRRYQRGEKGTGLLRGVGENYDGE